MTIEERTSRDAEDAERIANVLSCERKQGAQRFEILSSA